MCSGGYENEREAPSMGPSPIINIKKEKRETEEETKEILRSLERDNVSPCVFALPYKVAIFTILGFDCPLSRFLFSLLTIPS